MLSDEQLDRLLADQQDILKTFMRYIQKTSEKVPEEIREQVGSLEVFDQDDELSKEVVRENIRYFLSLIEPAYTSIVWTEIENNQRQEFLDFLQMIGRSISEQSANNPEKVIALNLAIKEIWDNTIVATSNTHISQGVDK
jgi:hypothetical protein